MMKRDDTVVVVGGGIIGLATAYFLVKKGFHVTVLERGNVGNSASLGNAGWIVPSLSAPLPEPGLWRVALRSLGRSEAPLFIAPRLSPSRARWLWEFWRNCNDDAHRKGFEATIRLNERTMSLYEEWHSAGVPFSMWSRGLLFSFLEKSDAERELARLHSLHHRSYDLPETPLSGEAIRSLEPSLSDHVQAGFLVKQERHVEPASVTNGLATHLRGRGAEILEGVEVTGFRQRSATVTAIRTSRGLIETSRIVLAAGAWTGELARRLGLKIPLEAGKGYSFHIRMPRPPRHPLYLADAKIGITPFEDDRVRVAGTMELSGLNLRLDPRRINAMISHARRFLAPWPSGPLDDAWVGMRPMSPDGLPIIGRAEPYKNVYLSTGHNMLGVTLAPATGESLATLVTTDETPPVLRPFSPNRFQRGKGRVHA